MWQNDPKCVSFSDVEANSVGLGQKSLVLRTHPSWLSSHHCEAIRMWWRSQCWNLGTTQAILVPWLKIDYMKYETAWLPTSKQLLAFGFWMCYFWLFKCRMCVWAENATDEKRVKNGLYRPVLSNAIQRYGLEKVEWPGAATTSAWDVLRTSSTATQVLKTGAMDGPRPELLQPKKRTHWINMTYTCIWILWNFVNMYINRYIYIYI